MRFLLANLSRLAIVISATLIAVSQASGGYSGTVLYGLYPSSSAFDYAVSSAADGQVVGIHDSDALLWTAPSGTIVNLTPSGFDDAGVSATDGTQQVGSGGGTAVGFSNHALLWSGTAASVVDLHPSGFDYSVAVGVNGSQQVGHGSGTATGGLDHALVWYGAASSAVDLNPSGFYISYASGTNGAKQVGEAVETATDDYHAMLWSGSAESAVDLHPSGFSQSFAFGISGSQEVGSGIEVLVTDNLHALLWFDTAASAVDLNPSGFDISEAFGTNGSKQVGYGNLSGDFNNHALLWSGTAASSVDLHALLPAGGSWTDSTAYSIDADGNVFGIANGTYNDVSGTFAVEWSPVPEPASVGLMALGMAVTIFTRRANQRARPCGGCDGKIREEGKRKVQETLGA